MIYVYRCKKCSNEFEAEQKMKDDPLTECNQCGGPVHRVIQQVGISFVGPGFYSTDYGRAKPSFSEYKKAAKEGAV